MKRSVLHVDANSAYLSWSAVDMLEHGYPLDVRTVPSAIAGDPANRHGIILTKSIPAKKFGIKTGESLFEAKIKCPELLVFAPNYDLYLDCSNAMHGILSEYSNKIERYSVDESFIEYTGSEEALGNPEDIAMQIKERIKRELGFTVNVGLGDNKLLAKMASELKKPDNFHTLYTHEIPEKMWTLDVGELFYVGRATEKKLKNIGIKTIGELANSDIDLIKSLLKPVHGQLVHNYANGIDDSPVAPNNEIVQKGVGNSITIPYDVTTFEDAYGVLLALTERVGTRLRKLAASARVISVTIRNSDLSFYRHQRKIDHEVESTDEIYDLVCLIFAEAWRGDPIRHLGVHLSTLSRNANRQISLFERKDIEELKKIDKTVDNIRKIYGDESIIRGRFANSDNPAMLGGVNDGNYLMMGGYSL